ncbi:DUF421 domain-containing protein [Paenibacillus eucommiae]|uniref:Uncharacterized membrane protein YcaP (DUF421 family) n=1 Tax=Paenibacillus eucommiae TaxID=1355755 RepID=A0ABS4IQU9_9BACL|nr:YetF domain-containing protein [Paenibacillus eucommiae]MBP1989893.1 uncharacterized membrane protein YcaP (DUF421 family) [Paenibacillus eucommiae]
MFIMIFLKLAIGFLGLWVITFVIGKKEIGQITPLDFFTAILLSEIVGNTIYDDNVTYLHLIYALFLWMLFSYSIEKLSNHFIQFRRLTEGRAVLLVDKGEINQKLLQACKLDFNQLIVMLREKEIFDFSEVAYVLYETNGKISVIKKPEYEYVRIKDLGLQVKQESPSIPVIEKGQILLDTIRGIKMNEVHIRSMAKEQGFTEIKEIAYAEYNQEENKLVIIKKR